MKLWYLPDGASGLGPAFWRPFPIECCCAMGSSMAQEFHKGFECSESTQCAVQMLGSKAMRWHELGHCKNWHTHTHLDPRFTTCPKQLSLKWELKRKRSKTLLRLTVAVVYHYPTLEDLGECGYLQWSCRLCCCYWYYLVLLCRAVGIVRS